MYTSRDAGRVPRKQCLSLLGDYRKSKRIMASTNRILVKNETAGRTGGDGRIAKETTPAVRYRPAGGGGRLLHFGCAGVVYRRSGRWRPKPVGRRLRARWTS